jgi:hypothetical protein
MRLNKVFLVLASTAWWAVAGPASAQNGTAAGATKAAAAPAAASPAPTGAPATTAPAASAPAASATPATTTKPATTSTAPAASTSATATASGSGSTTGLDGGTYVVRLRDLEQRIDDLKEQIRRSHTRLSLLSDTILSGGVGGARAEITFKNDMSGAFRLVGAIFVLDGAVQYNRQDDSEQGLLASQKEIPIFSGSIPPGDHTLQVVVRLRGHGYGVFSYLRSYKFEVPWSHSFTVGEGKTLALDVIAFEKGDVTTPVEQRPAIRSAETTRVGFTGSAPPPAPKPGSGVKAGGSGSVSIGAGSK